MSLSLSLKRFAIAAAAAALPVIASAQMPAYHVTNLSDLSAAAGLSNCYARSLNDSGTVVGGCNDSATTQIAVAWRNGTVVEIGRLAAGQWAFGSAVNSLGVVVGDADPGNGRPNPFVTLNGKLIDVDSISGGNARAIGISDTGLIFGSLIKGFDGNPWNAMMWTVDSGHPDRYRETFLPKPAGTDPKTTSTYLNESNKLGQATGYVSGTNGEFGAFWNNDSTHSVVVLQPLPGGWSSWAQGMNDLGQTVGMSYDGSVIQQTAVLWQNDAAHSVVSLGMLPGDTMSFANDINTAGQVVGVSAVGSLQRAFLWQSGTMVDLATLVDPADGTWSISQALSINNAGQIVAFGSSNGVTSAILLTPVTQ
jgi:probable HAF family extracellular repeat protein